MKLPRDVNVASQFRDGASGGDGAEAFDVVKAFDVVETFDVSGRWVWRGSGGRNAHLVRERSVRSSSPWSLCGKRVRGPRLAWRGVCHVCRRRSVDLDTEPTPVNDRVLMTTPAVVRVNR